MKLAKRKKSKASILLQGLSGKGKTGAALTIARGLTTSWDKVALCDTENKSAQLFVDTPCAMGGHFESFLVEELDATTGYKPTTYTQFIKDAIKAGADVAINDSITHAWQSEAGVLAMVANLECVNGSKGKFNAWNNADVIREKATLNAMIRNPEIHVISTCRMKEKITMSVGADGKSTVESLGEQPIQQDTLKYEPDLVLTMLRPGDVTAEGVVHPLAIVVKSRYAFCKVYEFVEISPEWVARLKAYLDEGMSAEDVAKAEKEELVPKITDLLKTKPSLKPVYKMVLDRFGHPDAKLKDLETPTLKQIYQELTREVI